MLLEETEFERDVLLHKIGFDAVTTVSQTPTGFNSDEVPISDNVCFGLEVEGKFSELDRPVDTSDLDEWRICVSFGD